MTPKSNGSTIPITRRELERAWRVSRSAAQIAEPTNAHRLLLFYAIECGLKALYLKQRRTEVLDKAIIEQLGHNLNKALDEVKAGKALHLPDNLTIEPFKSNNNPASRKCNNSQINQVWRYGAKFIAPSDDATLEQKLTTIAKWIESYPI